MHRGYIKIWRKVKDSGLYQLPNAFTLFVYMLTEATHKSTRRGTVDLERGQLCTGRHQLSKDLGLSERSIRTALEHLVKLNMITGKSTNKFTVYTIVNYNNYQDNDQQATNERPAKDQQATNNRPLIQEHKKLNTNNKSIRASRLSPDINLSDEWGEIALGIRSDWFNEDVIQEFECFKDYWISIGGQKGSRTDWLATWRNWCRRSNRKAAA